MSKNKKKNRKEVLRRVIPLILILLMLVTTILSSVMAFAADESYWPTGIEVSPSAAIVMEASTGTILYEKNIDEKHYPASITKILTGLLAVENADMDAEVTFSADAVAESAGGTSSIARDVGEVMTMEQCLYGMMLESANECAYAIAEYIGGGDINVFLDMMNEKAKELGCTGSHFNNPNGLPDENHYTTAHDMALISQAAVNNETLAQIMATKSYTIPPTNKHEEETLLNNHHSMLNYYKTSKYLYDGCLGGKTGYTDVANNTLVTFAERDGMKLICVVMEVDSPYHYTDTISLFDYCFDNFKLEDASSNENIFSNIGEDSIGALAENIDLTEASVSGTVVLPKTASASDLTISVEPKSDESNPSVVGQVIYSYGERQVGTGDLIFTATDQTEYPFHNLSEEEGGSSVAYYRLNFLLVLEILIIIAAGCGVIFILYHQWNKWSVRIHRHREAKRRNKPQYTVIKRRRKRRK
ncbi:MAG: D-alanyl-D-alanine carboxypeptidase [Lachnospiraceae bacterium]|nr:D-alanyl-D-alanine carboxypeptidase [Lachnospiraceae bacterium]